MPHVYPISCLRRVLIMRSISSGSQLGLPKNISTNHRSQRLLILIIYTSYPSAVKRVGCRTELFWVDCSLSKLTGKSSSLSKKVEFYLFSKQGCRISAAKNVYQLFLTFLFFSPSCVSSLRHILLYRFDKIFLLHQLNRILHFLNLGRVLWIYSCWYRPSTKLGSSRRSSLCRTRHHIVRK